MTTSGKYKDLAERVGALVDEKNQAYGNSFDDCGQFLKLLYPEGIPTDKYSDMLCIVRIFDKLKRIATKKDAFGESPYSDIVGYGLLGLEKDNRGKKLQLDTNLAKITERIEELETQEAQARAKEDSPPPSQQPAVKVKLPKIRCSICDKPVENVPTSVAELPGQKFAHETCFNSTLTAQKQA